MLERVPDASHALLPTGDLPSTASKAGGGRGKGGARKKGSVKGRGHGLSRGGEGGKDADSDHAAGSVLEGLSALMGDDKAGTALCEGVVVPLEILGRAAVRAGGGMGWVGELAMGGVLLWVIALSFLSWASCCVMGHVAWIREWCLHGIWISKWCLPGMVTCRAVASRHVLWRACSKRA